jgi:23S rRNA (pseudouridine1915-N3)-methyltransferase
VRPVVACVGKAGHPWAEPAVADYARRLRRWEGVDALWLKPERFVGDVAAVRTAEGARLLAAVAPRDRLVVLDERGDDLDTPTFTALVQQARLDGVGRLVLAIGGAYGHADTSRRAAHRVVRLSAMVLNHEVARVVLYEQLYRAYAALHGVPYAH